ncbi:MULTISPECIES: nucleotidyltransferase family protein [Acidobacteriaceae]|uniref:nucleotidyltransferase family protein n=1 Tax=Acidobacteriaceae TaxID=204434 RepID=UPI00131C503B|nr:MULTISPECIES: nucleotidyltransferase family protein [Acidobacteriaceae]MDW5265165.1 nucleotidyltransferase family protein [Edaphobacter sp.]
MDQPLGIQAAASLPVRLNGFAFQSLRDEHMVREAVLLIFCNPLPPRCSQLRYLSRRKWQKLLRWLDLSGLALYFFDRVVELQLADFVPAPVLASLEQRLIQNTQRTHSMTAESIAIQREFQRAGLRYTVLKGLSLWPNSAPSPELRLQFDLDYLVDDENLQEARDILVRRGYRPSASNERCWKFVRNYGSALTLKDVYRDTGSWAVELHDVSGGSGRASPLLRLEWRELCGLSMPTLSPVDVFLRQGLHAYKDVCSQFFRLSLLIEFYRHVLFRRDDDAFWKALHREAHGNPQAALGLGVVILLITQVMGEFAPEALTHWTVDRLPRPARLWVATYGRRIVLGSFPGSKLYRLLKRELEAGVYPAEHSLRHSPSPSSPPAPMMMDFPVETFSIRLIRFVRLMRYRMQLDLIPSRLRFYGIEGLRLAWETRRLRRMMKQDAP